MVGPAGMRELMPLYTGLTHYTQVVLFGEQHDHPILKHLSFLNIICWSNKIHLQVIALIIIIQSLIYRILTQGYRNYLIHDKNKANIFCVPTVCHISIPDEKRGKCYIHTVSFMTQFSDTVSLLGEFLLVSDIVQTRV